MDIEGIRLFVLAADLLNISAAGRQLGLAPAVASARLSKLENQVGADLLHRSTRKVSLSMEGAEFLPFAREILSQEGAARAALGNGRSEVSGTLRFAASSTFAQLFIAPILPEFLERHPGVNLELKLSDTQMNLIEGGFDLALRNYAIEDSSLRARKLADDKRILCASPEYLARHGMPRTPDDLVKHQLLTFMNGSAKKLSSRTGGPAATFPPAGAKNRVSCDDGTSMRIATRAGVGISMNACWSIYKDMHDGTLVRVLPDYEVEDRSAIWLVYPKSNVLTAKVRVFIDFLLEKIGDPPVWER
ncbi:LysR substrate-binding domain-containing protein [Marinobacterium rhizophilum]|uniref:LysR family transcriptional regulator n=1 Tax=Marinobacterium rhizophilum TaxID=420402 RepID=A0ABY5HM70_9GAMM|nr:LysR substrate-binding domain-containing protein [Marinobacterium rhizophilum]UTW13358.1 LysR family transcriptional regulator [Marinobacterium rhizophilum]